MERYVLTGGHGVGKSSIIQCLEGRGEWIIPEVAASVLALGRARGVPFADDQPDFDATVLEWQVRRESRVPGDAVRVFLDRGLPDVLAYATLGRRRLTEEQHQLCLACRYSRVFHIEEPPGGVPTVGKGEAEFCRRLTSTLAMTYSDLGIQSEYVPYGPVDERVNFILGVIAEC